MNFERMFERARRQIEPDGLNLPEGARLLDEFLRVAQSKSIIETFFARRNGDCLKVDVQGVGWSFRRDNWGLVGGTKRARDARRGGVIVPNSKPSDFSFRFYDSSPYLFALYIQEELLRDLKYQRFADGRLKLRTLSIEWRPGHQDIPTASQIEQYFERLADFLVRGEKILLQRTEELRTKRAKWDAAHPEPETPARG